MARLLGFIISVVFVLTSAEYARSVVLPTKTLNDGNKMPAMGLGTWRYTSPPDEPIDAIRQAVVWALEAGYRLIDTAYIYHDEAQVGQGIAEAIAAGVVTREEVFVCTKLWNDQHKREQVIPALKSQLEALNLTYTDLYLVHFPQAHESDYTPLDIDYLETWSGMEEAKRLGLAKSIGVANFNDTQFKRLIDNVNILPAVAQIEVNPTNTFVDLVDLYQSYGLQVMAYSPLGFAVNRKDDVDFKPPPQFDDPALVGPAEKYGKKPVQILLRYLIERDLIPIPKSTNQTHIIDNVDLFDFSLTPEEVATIGAYNINYRVNKKLFDRYYTNGYNNPYIARREFGFDLRVEGITAHGNDWSANQSTACAYTPR